MNNTEDFVYRECSSGFISVAIFVISHFTEGVIFEISFLVNLEWMDTLESDKKSKECKIWWNNICYINVQFRYSLYLNFTKTLIWSKPLKSINLTRAVRFFIVLGSKNLNLGACEGVKHDKYERKIDNTL